MSHFTTLKTQFVAAEPLTLALADVRAQFGLGEIRLNELIRGWSGNTVRGDLVLATRNSGYDVGFVKEGETYNLKGDQFGLHDFKLEQLQDALKQRYAYHATLQQLQKDGFTPVEETNQADRTIHLVLRRTV
jgi:hypothetical protein